MAATFLCLGIVAPREPASRLVFVRSPTLHHPSDIYSLDASGRGLANLTNHTSPTQYPWGPEDAARSALPRQLTECNQVL